jgi:hypothetical protein
MYKHDTQAYNTIFKFRGNYNRWPILKASIKIGFFKKLYKIIPVFSKQKKC